jgi:predicted aspartyl protease
MSATGFVEVNTYFAGGALMGQGFSAILVPASIPLIGYELLENLRFRVNPLTQEIEKAPEDEAHPPYLL